MGEKLPSRDESLENRVDRVDNYVELAERERQESYNSPESARDFLTKQEYREYAAEGLGFEDLTEQQQRVVEGQYKMHYAEHFIQKDAEERINDIIEKNNQVVEGGGEGVLLNDESLKEAVELYIDL